MIKITDRIKPPKYRVGKYMLNEYELRRLMAQVADGKYPHGIRVTDANKVTATINPDGTLSCNLYGLAISSLYTLEILRIRREKRNQQ
jgi:hypothetical protein